MKDLGAASGVSGLKIWHAAELESILTTANVTKRKREGRKGVRF